MWQNVVRCFVAQKPFFEFVVSEEQQGRKPHFCPLLTYVQNWPSKNKVRVL